MQHLLLAECFHVSLSFFCSLDLVQINAELVRANLSHLRVFILPEVSTDIQFISPGAIAFGERSHFVQVTC
jgi:hypothetical protein